MDFRCAKCMQARNEEKMRPHRLWLCSHYIGWLLVPRKAIRNGVNAALLSPCPLKPIVRRDRRALLAKSNGVFIAKYFSTSIHVTDCTPIYRRNSLLAALKTWSELCPDYEESPLLLRDSRASETRAHLKITPREKSETRHALLVV